MRRLDLVIGPNGAGKSTFIARALALQLPGSALISSGRSFIAETVFSHPSKLDLLTSARKSGYTIGVHVLLIPEAMAVERVRARVAAGGHDVPEDKIRERYRRLWSLVAGAMARADKATAYDNSCRKGPQIVAELSGGFIVGATAWPEWTPEALRAIS